VATRLARPVGRKGATKSQVVPVSGAGCAGPDPAGATNKNILYQQELCRGRLSTSGRCDPFLTPIFHHEWDESGRRLAKQVTASPRSY